VNRTIRRRRLIHDSKGEFKIFDARLLITVSRHKRAPWWIFSNFRPQTTVLVAQVVVKTTVVVFPAAVDRLQFPFMTKRAANNKEK
jgi:hypothetical protein